MALFQSVLSCFGIFSADTIKSSKCFIATVNHFPIKSDTQPDTHFGWAWVCVWPLRCAVVNTTQLYMLSHDQHEEEYCHSWEQELLSFLSTSKYSISLLTFQLLNECESIFVFSLKAVIKSRQNDHIYELSTHESNHHHKVLITCGELFISRISELKECKIKSIITKATWYLIIIRSCE